MKHALEEVLKGKHAPGDILTYKRGSGTGTGRVVGVRTENGAITEVTVHTTNGRKRVSARDILETEGLTRFSCWEGQRVRLVRKNGNVYLGRIRSWGDLFIKITVDNGNVGYVTPVEEVEGVYSRETAC